MASPWRGTKTSSCRNRDVPRPQFEVGAARERSRNLWKSKQNRCTCISCGHCIYIHDNLSNINLQVKKGSNLIRTKVEIKKIWKKCIFFGGDIVFNDQMKK